jgi:hypothetical protein
MSDTEKFFVLAILLLGLFGIILLGIGVTGNVISGEYTLGDVCSSDSDCQNGNICCIFYNKESGVCQTADMCETVSKITLEEENRLFAYNEFSKEKPDINKTYTFEIVIGILILAMVCLALYILYTGKKEKSSKKKNKTGKNIKKRKKK